MLLPQFPAPNPLQVVTYLHDYFTLYFRLWYMFKEMMDSYIKKKIIRVLGIMFNKCQGYFTGNSPSIKAAKGSSMFSLFIVPPSL